MRKIEIGDKVRFNNKKVQIYHFKYVSDLNNRFGFVFTVIDIIDCNIYLGDDKGVDLPISDIFGGSWHSEALELNE